MFFAKERSNIIVRPNRCPSAPELLRYADRELDDTQRRTLEKHLSSCPRCTALVSEYQEVDALLVTPEPIPVGPDVWAGIRRRITQPAQTRAIRIPARLLPRYVLPLAAAALVVLAVFTARMLQETITHGTQQAIIESVNLPTEDGRAAFEPDTILDALDDTSAVKDSASTRHSE
ncbi:MAG: zf-HC2 domain-containing protein [candidate division WOR-3 bacterium]